MRTLVTILLCSSCVCLPVVSRAAGSCEGTKDHPVEICFDDPPLVVNHCTREIELHFSVGLLPFDNGIRPPYYFTYQLARGGVQDKLENPLNDKPLLTGADPLSQIPDAVHIPYRGPSDIAVTITVHAEGRDAETRTSNLVHISDPLLVTAIVVGVSKYSSPSVPQLSHADDDARSFDEFLKALFPQTLSSTLLTSDNDVSKQPTLNHINDAITDEKLAPHSCSNDDWFIFYFSGHGVVGSNEAIVGEKGAVATHYLSTSSLDPANLPTTALPIEDLLHEMRHLPAGNKIIILDSCFSGSSKRFHSSSTSDSQSTKGALTQERTVTRSYKVAYIYHKSVVDPYEFGIKNPQRGSGDLLAFKEVPEEEETDSRRALYLSASMSDHEAEEGFEQYSENRLSFTPSDDEKEAEKPLGHGLYTFTVLWNLLAQLPKNAVLPEILKGQNPTPSAAGPCSIDFSSAHDVGSGDIARLRVQSHSTNHARDYQRPEVAGHTQTFPPALPCQIRLRNTSSSEPQ